MEEMVRELIVRRTVILPDKDTGYWLGRKTWYSLTPRQKERFKKLRKEKKCIKIVYHCGKTHPTYIDEFLPSGL